ncbi:hypothetical protein DYB30_001153 [Aphanomyces astaci]|uniref:GH16 domain-containing protein n=1 Tax=Aphanomyces astaci TaxID=112090 RepID=A0A397DDM0_APHAT|nr:hypothetical protein DYB30_001153 [Aphanomyces astaci]
MRVVAAAAATVTSMVTALAVKEEYLIFEEDFDSTFDLSVWKHDITLGGNGNREFEVYVNSRNNSYVKDGKLHLRATLTDEAYGRESIENGVMDLWGTSPYSSCSSPQFAGCRKEANGHDILPPVQSARIQTMESFSFKYGRVEVRTKLPRGDWLWPGIWMMAKDNRYGPWPSSGELDIMESRGNGPDYTDDKGNPIGNNRFSACFHFGPAWNKDGYPVAVNDTQALPDHRSYGDEFHTFGFYWDEDDMYAYVDSPENVVTRVAEYGKKSFWDIGLESGAWNASDSFNNFQEGPINAPFDQEMYLIMNVAVGGTSIAKGFLDSGYFPDDQGDKPWHTNDSYPAANFYHQKDKWFPSWTTNEDGTNTATGRASDFSAMQVDSVKVWGIRGLTTFTNSKNAVHRYDGREDGQAVESRVHYGPFNMSTGSEPQLTRFNRMNNQTNESDDGFHLYGLYWDENELYMYVDSRDNIVSRVHGYGTSSLWQSQWGDVNDTSPYRQQRLQAPFDQQFYLSVGLRVGGTDGFFPDHVDGKPWNDTSSRHKETFDKALPEWGPTWSTKPDASWFEIDQVSVWATSAASSWTYHGSFAQAGEVDGDKLLFSDSFATLDMRHWKPEITMNTGGEFQMYVNHRQVGFVRSKTLVLRPALSADIIGNASLFEGYMDMWGTDVPSKCTAAAASGCGHVSSATDMAPPIHSASFRTAESFAFQYGHVQISATMPHGAAYLIPRLRLVPLTRDQGWLDIAVAKTEKTSSQTVVATGFCTNSTACDIAYHEIIPRSTHVYGVIWNATDTLVYIDSPAQVVWHRPTPPSHTVGDHAALHVHGVHVWSVPGTKWRARRLVGDPDVASALVQALVQQLNSIPKKKDMSWLWVGGGGAVLAGVLLLLVAPLRAKVMRRREYMAIPEP